MDPHETLKVARTIKERGNDCFKKGQLREAQRDYTEVLAMLTEKIAFTGDDQRKEKDILILTAHLNQAQCALQLGDDARALYHCNTALSMDSDNVKAHFRKGKAYENRGDFDEALERYRHVLTLEPDSKTAQRQLSECQEKLDSQRAEDEMHNKMVEQGVQDTEDEDVEVLYENSERDPQTRYKKCTKNPGHDKFINVNEFKLEDLPPDYRNPELFDHIKNQQSRITVLLQVWASRKFRSGCRPGTGRDNPGPGRRVRPLKHGSGWLCLVETHTEDELACPCHTCKDSGSPEKKWASIIIKTAGHVVCNDKEANNTECYFFYDTDEVDVSSCPKLCRAVIDMRDKQADYCSLKFICHDEKYFKQLDKISTSYSYSHHCIERKYKSPAVAEPEGSLLEQHKQLWQRYTELTREFGHLVERVVAILNEDPHLELVKHRKGRVERIEDDTLGQVLVDKIAGGFGYQEVTKGLQLEHEVFCEGLKEIAEHSSLLTLLVSYSDTTSRPPLLAHWQVKVKVVEKRVMGLKHWLDESVTVSPVEFNKGHRLTVIVSHPHGCSKKVTIGETTERETDHLGLWSQFTYNTPTCPGSSGALVFLLGQAVLINGYAHSAKRSGGSLGQLNESAFGVGM